MTGRVRAALCAILTALSVLLTPIGVWAQEAQATPEELAAARRLFNEGKELETKGEWAQALAKFDVVAKVKMTPQVRFHIALCHENLGRLVDAVNGFELAEQEARAAGARDVEQNAPKRAEALRARVARLTLTVTGTVHSSKIYLDGRTVSLALVDTAIPVDPGEHTVEVRRDGKVTFSETLSFEEAEARELDLAIDDPEPVELPDPKPDVTPKPEPPPIIVAPSDPPQWVAYVVGGVGVAALGVATTLYVLRNQKLSTLICDDPTNYIGCEPQGREAADTAEKFDVASKVMFGVGAVGLATGVALWFVLMPNDDPQPTTGTTKASWTLVPSPGGLWLTGAF